MIARDDRRQVSLCAKKPKLNPAFSDFARETGLEPATSAVHDFHYFRSGVDYIFTVGFPLGIPVSSLYGALLNIKRFPRYSHIPLWGLSLHRYPRKFQPPFRRGSCTSTGRRSNQLSYSRIFLNSLNLFLFLSRKSSFRTGTS